MHSPIRQIDEQRDPCRMLGLLRTKLENFSFGCEFVSSVNQKKP